MRGWAKMWVARMSIKGRLALLFAIVSIIPVVAVGMIALRTYSGNMLEKGVQDSLNRLDFIDYRAVEIVRGKHRDVLMIAFNEYVRVIFDEDSDSPLRANMTLVEDQARRQLISLHNSKDDASVALVGGDGRALSYGSAQSSAVKQLLLEPPSLDPARYPIFDRWGDARMEDGEAVIPYERLVLGTDNAPVAVLRMSVRESLMCDLYADYKETDGGGFYIVNARGTVQSSSDRGAIGRGVRDVLGFGLDELISKDSYFERGDDVITYERNQPRGLYFIERIPRGRFMAGFSSILRSMVLVALGCVVACVLLGSIMSRSFTKPLYRLIDRVRRIDVKSGGAHVSAGRNEITILSDKYDQILERLEVLIADYYEEQKKKKEAQIRALEFQINPHFLYNTLSTIVWLIEADAPRDAIRITKDLSAFFRISISKGREYITLFEELRHVELYIDIQKARYADSIVYTSEVPEEMLELYTPKLILQPLIENSIIHAMQTRADKTCRIRVLGRLEGDDVVLQVRDNGITITREVIDDMNAFLVDRGGAAKRDFGIGISNVNDRVYMCFGEGYGLWYRREEGETIAQIRIKVMRRREGDA